MYDNEYTVIVKMKNGNLKFLNSGKELVDNLKDSDIYGSISDARQDIINFKEYNKEIQNEVENYKIENYKVSSKLYEAKEKEKYSKVYTSNGYKIRYNFEDATIELIDEENNNDVLIANGLSVNDWKENPKQWVEQFADEIAEELSYMMDDNSFELKDELEEETFEDRENKNEFIDLINLVKSLMKTNDIGMMIMSEKAKNEIIKLLDLESKSEEELSKLRNKIVIELQDLASEAREISFDAYDPIHYAMTTSTATIDHILRNSKKEESNTKFKIGDKVKVRSALPHLRNKPATITNKTKDGYVYKWNDKDSGQGATDDTLELFKESIESTTPSYNKYKRKINQIAKNMEYTISEEMKHELAKSLEFTEEQDEDWVKHLMQEKALNLILEQINEKLISTDEITNNSFEEVFNNAKEGHYESSKEEYIQKAKVGDWIRFKQAGGVLSDEAAKVTKVNKEEGYYEYTFEDGEKSYGAADDMIVLAGSDEEDRYWELIENENEA